MGWSQTEATVHVTKRRIFLMKELGRGGWVGVKLKGLCHEHDSGDQLKGLYHETDILNEGAGEGDGMQSN